MYLARPAARACKAKPCFDGGSDEKHHAESTLDGSAPSDSPGHLCKLIVFDLPSLPQGSSYLTTEKARLDKILGSGSVAASKVEDFAKKSSILGHLTE